MTDEDRPTSVVAAMRVARDAWAVVGLSLLLFLGLEGAYRAQAVVRSALRASAREVDESAPLHPLASEVWWREWTAGAGLWETRFDPYRGLWSEPQDGRYLSIDSAGRRVTVQPTPVGEDRYLVFLFGGSTMFGYTARDAHTIPSELAALAADAGYDRVELVNLAQSTFNVTQGLNTLTLELRDGRRPDLVVFLDGNNEVAPAFQSGAAGGILNQELRSERLRRSDPGLADVIVDASKLIERIQRAVRPPPPARVRPNSAVVCPSVAATYVGALAVIEALGATFGFQTLFLWQPQLATTGKELTPFEQSLRTNPEWSDWIRLCTATVDQEVVRHGVDTYVPLHDLFDDWSSTVFLDDYAHVTEAGNRRIADAIWARIEPLLLDR